MKSKMAFIMSVEKFFDESPHVYMWTLTFREVMPAWWYMNTHTLFVREVQKWYKGFKGLRVTEIHDMHGVHYHWLVDTWMDVDLMRMLGKRFGIGRVHVVEADRGAALYLAKYMSKKHQAPAIRKMSKWGTLGGFVPCRIRDVEIQSKTFDRLKEVREDWCRFHGTNHVPYGVFLRLLKDVIAQGENKTTERLKQLCEEWRRINGQRHVPYDVYKKLEKIAEEEE